LLNRRLKSHYEHGVRSEFRAAGKDVRGCCSRIKKAEAQAREGGRGRGGLSRTGVSEVKAFEKKKGGKLGEENETCQIVKKSLFYKG